MLHAIWTAWQPLSTLAFESPELEAMFLSYDSRTFNLFTWLPLLLSVTAYPLLLAQMYRTGAPYRHLLPHLGPPILGHLLPAFLLLMVCSFFPSFFRKYRSVLSTAYLIGCTATCHEVRLLHLWRRLVNPGTRGTFLSLLQSFSCENLFFSMAWLAIMGLPGGPLLDVILVLGFMAVNVMGNTALCASPLWPADSVTMSPGPLTFAQFFTAALMDATHPHFSGSKVKVMTCPATLAFWQVLGAWLALLLAGLMEVVRRMAFLRTSEAKAWLGRDLDAAGLKWPFLGYIIWEKVVPALFRLSVVHIAVLVVLLNVFAE